MTSLERMADLDEAWAEPHHGAQLRRLRRAREQLRERFAGGPHCVAARFPNAKLLAPKTEWDDWDDLHPLQRAWFIRDGKAGVRTANVILTDGDLVLGDGVMLLRTPGHTVGNQTLFLNTDTGIWGIS